MRLFAMRRANVDAFEPGKGASDYDITETGRYQAIFVARHFANRGVSFADIYTGTSSRHRKTADLIADTISEIQGRGPSVTERECLDDVQWTEPALETCYERGLGQRAWISAWADGSLDTGETLSEARSRVLEGVSSLVADHGTADAVLLITSAIPMNLLVADALGTDVDQVQVQVDNTGIFEFDREDGQNEVVQLNALGHLTESMLTRGYFQGGD